MSDRLCISSYGTIKTLLSPNIILTCVENGNANDRLALKFLYILHLNKIIKSYLINLCSRRNELFSHILIRCVGGDPVDAWNYWISSGVPSGGIYGDISV